jgi:hypothetical protein
MMIKMHAGPHEYLKSSQKRTTRILLIAHCFFEQRHYFYASLSLLLLLIVGLCGYTHCYLPSLQVQESSLISAKTWLLSPSSYTDYNYLIDLSGWDNYNIGTFVETLRLAEQEKGRFYKHIGEDDYRECILSPIIDSFSAYDYSLRRELHDYCLPLIYDIRDPSKASIIIASNLSAKIGLDTSYPDHVGIETSWIQGVASERGWDRLLVATYRSIGIASRLNSNSKVEYLCGNKWVIAPFPLRTSNVLP